MQDIYDAEFASLHVRKSNHAATSLYMGSLGFEAHDVEKGYYADKEDALNLRLYFSEKAAAKHRKNASKEARAMQQQQQKQKQHGDLAKGIEGLSLQEQAVTEAGVKKKTSGKKSKSKKSKKK